MKYINIIFSALVIQISSVQALEAPNFKVAEDYRSIRQKMLKAGWQPYHRKNADICDDGDERCVGYPEMQACAGTGLGNCKFLWKKGTNIVAICTVDSPPKFDALCDLN